MTNLAPIAIGVKFPDAAKILSQLRTKRKKSKTNLADLEAILEILKSWGDKTLQQYLDKVAGIRRAQVTRKILICAVNPVLDTPD